LIADSVFRLLGVFRKLQGIGAAVLDEELQNQLVDQAKSLVEDICSDHVRAAQQFVKHESIRDSLVEVVQKECQELIEYIVAAKRFNLEVNSRSKDRVISFGEKLSCHFMTSLLHDEVSLPFFFFLMQCARHGPLNF
jgi:aspartate kinase